MRININNILLTDKNVTLTKEKYHSIQITKRRYVYYDPQVARVILNKPRGVPKIKLNRSNPCLLTNAKFPRMRSALGGRKTQNRAVSISNTSDISQL